VKLLPPQVRMHPRLFPCLNRGSVRQW
jgi:hypothetical protein